MLRSSCAIALLSQRCAQIGVRAAAVAQPAAAARFIHAARPSYLAEAASPSTATAAAATPASAVGADGLSKKTARRRRRNAGLVASIVAAGGAPQQVQSRPSRSAKARANKANLANLPAIEPATLVSPGAAAALPKQKVAMYSKLLRVVRSPVRGALPNTQGDDYTLGPDEGHSTHAHFTGLITANLTGPAKSRGGKKAGKDTGRSYGKGGRKSARAQVWIQKAVVKGTGDFYVNGLRYVEYFSQLDHRWEVCAPFFHTNTLTDFDMIAVVHGGGRSGQAGAIKHAAAKALQAYDRARYRGMLKKKFLLSRDARVVERKKYGQKKARKQFTFVKR